MNSKSQLWETVFKKQDEIVSREIAGETILVPVSGKVADMQRIFSLNTVAEYIWKQIDGKKNLREISDSILTIFDVQKEQADSDIQDFITELQKEDLIVKVN